MWVAKGPLSFLGLTTVAKRCLCLNVGQTQPARRNLQFVVALVDCVLTFSSLAIGLGVIFGVAALADMGIIDGLMLKMFLSIVCPLVTMTQFASPTPVVMEALRKLDVQNLPTPVFISQAACNILGTAYAIRIQNSTVLVNNMFGLACQTLFIGSCHYVKAGNRQWMWHSIKAQVIYCSGLYVCVEVISLDALGQVITIFNLILFAVPLASLGTILKTRNAASLPTAMTVVSTLANAVWSVYALLIKDMVVLVPSVLGFVLCAFQVLVLLWCHNKLPFDLSFLLLPCRSSGPPTKKIAPVVGEFGLPEENPEVTPSAIGNEVISDMEI